MAGSNLEIIISSSDLSSLEFFDNSSNCSLNCSSNGTGIDPELPYYLTFNEDSIREVILYSIMLVLGATGNLPVFITLIRNRHRKSRVNLMIMNLSIADLIVTFVMIPLEIAWRITVAWVAGNAVCKIMLFVRAFGPYLSSMILVCISLDRYFAILHPLKVNGAQKRGRIMIATAWTISSLCSIPQSVIFHLESHPDYPEFIQCVSFNFFPTKYHKMAYNIFCLLALYGVPLVIIIFCYSCILWEISKRSRDNDGDLSQESRYRGRPCLRRSDIAHIERARARTLRMTIIIVCTFFWCWTPYVVMVLWYLFDPVSADQVDTRIQSSLFMFAVSNSCVNPLVYGSYLLNFKQIFRRCYRRCRNRNMGSMNQTQITTPARTYATFRNGNLARRNISVHLNIRGNGTYPALVEECNSHLPPEVRQLRISNSCGKIYTKPFSVNTQTEAEIHSWDR
ncbi:adipokinetic hormone/corazonin-related peptide receptor variant I-like isoform X2 [Parasteatoda tepidariorum]|uniref:adipokinetic hormone/corazonin-related peptide receptor variant I-like isoform X2 n=1 Tax=Parasteatoda tepidariorum TaxID=114398 RepID=UPI001C721CEE|nr:gonadotropin-releasing hormone II receptor-like isoform X2 [Parasteatoda tepidariorum]